MGTLVKASRAFFVLVGGMVTAGPTAAQAYPTKPIRILIPFSAGSGSDILARVIGPKIFETWGQQVVVDNRPSAGGTVAGGIVAGAAPDGHTLMITSSAFAGTAALYDKLPYDTVRDFAGITLLFSGPQVIVVAPSLNVKSLKELITLARQKPKQLNFASAGIGSGTHYTAELFNLAAGIVTVHVPYKGVPEGLNDTISGRTHFSTPPIPTALPLVKSGRLLALAVTTLQRAPLLPEVPSASEALPGFEYYGWFGLLAPANTSRPVILKLNKEVGRILETSDMRDKIATLGGVPKSSTPEAFEKLIRDEIVTRRKVFGASGVKPE